MNAVVTCRIKVQDIPFAYCFLKIAPRHKAAIPESLLRTTFPKLNLWSLGSVPFAPAFERCKLFGRVPHGHDLSIRHRVIHTPKFARVVLSDIELDTARPWTIRIRSGRSNAVIQQP